MPLCMLSSINLEHKGAVDVWYDILVFMVMAPSLQKNII